MQPQFTLPYSEFKVAEILNQKFKPYSVFIPTSSQEKGIDLILYNRKATKDRVVTIQVKSSRAYYESNKLSKSKKTKFKHYLWLNRFEVQENADLFFLIGIYPEMPPDKNVNEVNCRSVDWETVILVFKKDEMKNFLDQVRLKRDPEKEDKMFAFGFDEMDNICWTRGCPEPEPQPMSEYLLKNRIDMIHEMLE